MVTPRRWAGTVAGCRALFACEARLESETWLGVAAHNGPLVIRVRSENDGARRTGIRCGGRVPRAVA